jgi:hypothetical protein
MGLSEAPEDEPEAIADVVQRPAERPPIPPDRLFEIIRDERGLDARIAKLDAYIRPGR